MLLLLYKKLFYYTGSHKYDYSSIWSEMLFLSHQKVSILYILILFDNVRINDEQNN